jgi:hypothetical protein
MKLSVGLFWASFLLGGALFGADDGTAADLKAGFFLLHDVCHEESQVDMITIVKTTPSDVTDYVKRVAATAKGDLATIGRMEDRDEALRTDDSPLPPFEQKVRSAIRADKEHSLLFGTEGAAFARALLLTQIEAGNYIMHIAKVLADEDSSAYRTRKLLKISAQWEKLRDEGVRLSAGR